MNNIEATGLYTIRTYVNGMVVSKHSVSIETDDLAWHLASEGEALTFGKYDSVRLTASDRRGIVAAAHDVN